MPAEVLSYFLKNSDRRTRLAFQVVLQCAPFLKGLKVSCVITVDSQSYGTLRELMDGLGIEYHRLSESGGRCLVLFYRPEELEAYLKRAEVYALICEYGYAAMELPEMLGRLSQRVAEYEEMNLGFPHEIGAFLGYPAGDVRGFIRNGGKDFLMTGYWKVYGNVPAAKMIFNQYDRAKNCAVNEFLTGKSIREIAL